MEQEALMRSIEFGRLIRLSLEAGYQPVRSNWTETAYQVDRRRERIREVQSVRYGVFIFGRWKKFEY